MAAMRRLAAPPLLAVVALAVLAALVWPNPATGVILPPPPPQGVAVVVDTTSDLVDPGGGKCSLRAAIGATNINGHAGNCDASLSEPGGTDGILFDIGTGTPLINISTSLPDITDKLTINGNTGGADRVELYGPGATPYFAGLTIDSSAPGTTIDHLTIDNFGGNEVTAYAANVTLTGNFIGTNASGTAVGAGGSGVYVTGANVTIGGSVGTSTEGSCTGVCNLISTGNQTAVTIGQFGTGAKIQGNFIGTDVTGTAGLGNHYGIAVYGTGATIGGASPVQRNVIADAPVAEIEMLATGSVTGNFIGTNSSGTAAFPGNGIGLLAGVDAGGSVVGGTSPGAGNLISGASQNTGNGLTVFADHVEILGNLIGTEVDGTSPLPNSGDGIFFEGGRYATVGGTSAGAANTIAFNGGSGSEQSYQSNNASTGDTIRGNSIYSNGGRGIKNTNGGNNQLAPPAISQANHSGAEGTACSNCVIDIYSDDADEGRIYEGSTTASDTSWTFSGSIVGPNVTATATDSAGNTSEFSLLYAVGLAPTPTSSPTHTPTPTPTSTPDSQTPTPTPTSSPSPTVAPCGSPQYRGDADGNGHVDINDVLATLSALAHVPPGVACAGLAEVDCDGDLGADDALRILDFVAGAPLAQPTNCPGVGTLT